MYCYCGFVIILPSILCITIEPPQLPGFELDLSSYLDPNDGYLAGSETPIFLAESDDSEEYGVRYDQVHDVIKTDTFKLYDDSDYIDYLFARNEKYNKSSKELFKNTTSGSELNDSDGSDDDCTTDQCWDDESPPLTMDAIPDEFPVINDLPETIYPQLLIIMETSLFDIFHQNVTEAITYILAYWNAVDLRYRSFIDPKVRLNIAGIILAKDPNATPYIKKSLIKLNDTKEKRNLLFCNLTLENFAEYYYPQTSYDEEKNILSLNKPKIEFDAVIGMTAHNLCEFNRDCVKLNKYICQDHKIAVRKYCPSLGSAYYTGAGAYDPSTKKTEAFALIEDQGGFGTILSAAHEVGHLLGASHSITNENHCPIDDSYIMSYRITVTRKFFLWSNCSVYSIKNFLQQEERAKTLFNKPNIGTKIQRILPGRLYDRHKICKRITGSDSFCSNTTHTSDCVSLYCRTKWTDKCDMISNTFVPEGSTCGKERVCINSKCVSKSDDIIIPVKIGVH